MRGIGDPAAYARRKENEHRAYLFALALNNVMGNTVEQRHRALHGGLEPLLKNINFGSNGFLDLVDAQHLKRGSLGGFNCLLTIRTNISEKFLLISPKVRISRKVRKIIPVLSFGLMRTSGLSDY